MESVATWWSCIIRQEMLRYLAPMPPSRQGKLRDGASHIQEHSTNHASSSPRYNWYRRSFFFVAAFLRASANVTVSFPWPLEAWNAASYDSVASSFLHEQDLHDLALAIWFQCAFYTPRNGRVSATLFEFQCIRSNPECSQSSRACLF